VLSGQGDFLEGYPVPMNFRAAGPTWANFPAAILYTFNPTLTIESVKV